MGFREQLIVVGIDGSAGGRVALTWALEHAGRTGATLHVVSAYTADRHRADQMQQRDVAAVLPGIDAPPVVGREIVPGEPVAVLTAAAAGAALLVVGSHGSSRVRSGPMGSVSAGCISSCACPVLVVPTPTSAPRQREVATRVRRL